MIKKFFNGIKGPQLFSCLFFLGLGLLIILLSVKQYKQHSQKTIQAGAASDYAGGGLAPEDLNTMFASQDILSGDYRVVSEKNLFTPDRKAWEPPAEAEGEQQGNLQSGRRTRIDPMAFKLYGITFVQDEKQALIYYQHLAGKNRHRLLSEGQSVYQDGNQESEVFRVSKIDTESVTLRMQNGESFEIGLYAHERQLVSTGSQGQLSIVIGGDDSITTVSSDLPSSRTDSQSPVASSSDKQPDSETPVSDTPTPVETQKDDEEETENQKKQTRPLNPLEAFRQMRQADGDESGQATPSRQTYTEEMEKKIQEGSMRRIDTPFGPVYRPTQ